MNRAWIKVDTGLPRCPKLHAFRVRLGWDVDRAVGFLVRFWSSVQDWAGDGALPETWAETFVEPLGMSPEDAADISDALAASGFVDVLEDGSAAVHDWDDWGAELHKRREQGRERARRHREKTCESNALHNADVTRTKRSNNALEKRREEKRIAIPPLPPPGGDGQTDRPQPESQSETQPDLDDATSATETALPCEIGTAEESKAVEAPERAPEARESRNSVAVDWESAANRFWAAYPPAGKRHGRVAVLSAFRLAVEERKANPDDILAGVQAFAAAVARWKPEDARFIPSATTFLIEERWTADPASWKREAPLAHMHDPRALDGIEADAKRLRENGGKLW